MVDDLKAAVNELSSNASSDHIAIIGMAGRFPGANDLTTFWNNLQAGIESITRLGDEVVLPDGTTIKLPNEPNYVPARGILKGAADFDAKFFGINPYEARLMDPQQRVFLEVAWEALENAGYNPDRVDGSIAVMAGMEYSTYLENVILKNDCNASYFERTIANHTAFLSTKTSYKLNLKGPSLNINTACSTSLVAIVTACKMLANYECDMAVAGASAIELPETGYWSQDQDILSNDGHCRAFDENATGMVPGNAVACVILKRLDNALEDGDHIEAVLVGYAMNNDGADKAGYTAPSISGQSECIAEALARGEIDPSTINYIEAHGTGTQLGDPIEIQALTEIFDQYVSPQQIAIGSVKSNIGHTYSTAGIAGLIKTVLALQHQQLPPSLFCKTPNKKINFPQTPFYVNTELTQWPENIDNLPRRAGVSSFGIGGTNAHVIVEEAPILPPSSESRENQLLTLSAKTATALSTKILELREIIRNQQPPNNTLADICYTLNIGRKPFSHRTAINFTNHQEAIEQLDSLANVSIDPIKEQPKLVFMFSGQGSQYSKMGIELYQKETVFRDAIDECAVILYPMLNLDIREIIFDETNADKLNNTKYTQPALFSIEYAIAKQLHHWGIKADAMIGHSIGEYVAAYFAGVFNLEDALHIVSVRGKLMSSVASGTMLAVNLTEAELNPYLNQEISLAVLNSPELSVISGPEHAVSSLEKTLAATFKDKKLHLSRLHTSHAFHSSMMESILSDFIAAFDEITLQPLAGKVISNLHGKYLQNTDVTNPTYWAQQLRQTVKFSPGIQTLLDDQYHVFIEIGPSKALASLVAQHSGGPVSIETLPHPKDTFSSTATITNSLATLWTHGVEVNWENYYENELRHRLSLPTYPFEKQTYWGFEKTPNIKPYALTHTFEQDITHEISTISKTDEKLPKPENDALVTLNITDIIKQIASYYQQTLAVKDINIESQFFELGGTSIRALKLLAAIEKEFKLKIPLNAIYANPTVEALAAYIQNELKQAHELTEQSDQ